MRSCGWRHGLPRLPPGTPSWCHGFCQRENKLITIIILHRTTSAKKRATATLRQRHIPPNVSCKAELINKLKAVAQARDLQPFPATFPSLQNTYFCPFHPFTYTLSSIKMEIFYIICEKRTKNCVTNEHLVTCTV